MAETTMDKTQQNDLAAMLGTPQVETEPEPNEGDENVQGKEGTEEELRQDEGKDEGSEEQEAEEYEGGETPEGGTSTDGKEAEEAEVTVKDLQAQLQTLMAKIDNLTSGKQEEEQEQEEEKPEALPTIDFVGKDIDFDAVISDKDEFNKVLQKAADHGYNKAIEATLRLIPNMVVRVARVEVQQQAAANEFYRANDDLVPHKASVSKIYTEMLKANPEKNPYDVLRGLAPEVRKRLKLKPKGQQQQPSQKKKGVFAPGTGRGERGAANQSKVNPVKADIGKMLSL